MAPYRLPVARLCHTHAYCKRYAHRAHPLPHPTGVESRLQQIVECQALDAVHESQRLIGSRCGQEPPTGPPERHVASLEPAVGREQPRSEGDMIGTSFEPARSLRANIEREECRGEPVLGVARAIKRGAGVGEDLLLSRDGGEELVRRQDDHGSDREGYQNLDQREAATCVPTTTHGSPPADTRL